MMNLSPKALRLRTQLVLFFIFQTGLLLFVAGFYADWRLRRLVENELAAKLTTLAQIAAVEAGVAPVAGLAPGDEASNTVAYLHRIFRPLLQQGSLARLLIADAGLRTYYDSRGEIAIGQEYVRLRFDQPEIAQALAGQPAAARLFFDRTGQPFMAAYAKLANDGESGLFVCAEGDARSLAAVRAMRRNLLSIGAIALALAALAALVISRGITRPLVRLNDAAAEIGRGRYAVPVHASGSPEVAFLAQTLDDMRKAILQRENRQRLMLAGIAHEIRNPLGGIELFANVLQKQATPELQPHLQKILGEVKHLRQIVSEFLEFARPTQPKRESVTLQRAVAETLELLGGCREKVDIRTEFESEIAAFVDPDHLQRMLLNLLHNACEAVAAAEHPWIRIRGREEKGRVVLEIADNGPGIADAAREKIFEPFFTTRHQGTGLGLALVKQLAEDNGGRLILEKWEGGCTFALDLPASDRA